MGLRKRSGVTRRGHASIANMDRTQPARERERLGRSRTLDLLRRHVPEVSIGPMVPVMTADSPRPSTGWDAVSLEPAKIMSSLPRSGTIERGRAQRARYLGDDVRTGRSRSRSVSPSPVVSNQINADLWGKIILVAAPGEVPALNKEVAAALRRDALWKTFAARRAPRLWGALAAAPPGRDRFRRAVLLERDRPIGRGRAAFAAPALDESLTCIVIVTQGDTEVFRARFPFEPNVADREFYDGGAQVNCSVASQHGLSAARKAWDDARNIIVEPEISIPIDSVTGPALNMCPCPGPGSLTTHYLLERPDGRVAKLVVFDSGHIRARDCMSHASDDWFEHMAWSDQIVYLPGPTKWKFAFVLALTFPGYDEETFAPYTPWEDGRVFSLELQATNSPVEINFGVKKPYGEEASQQVIADLQRSIAGLTWH